MGRVTRTTSPLESGADDPRRRVRGTAEGGSPARLRGSETAGVAPGLVALVVGAALLLAGCVAGSGWVYRDGRPADPRDELRCEEYVASQNGMRFTGFENHDRHKCMRALGYVRWTEVAP